MPVFEPDVQRYLDGVESQHRTQPRFMSTLRAILEKIDAATIVARSTPVSYYVHNAVGVQLDLVGSLVGSDRRFPPVSIPGYPELLSDDLFRSVVLAKIVQNHWDGTNGTFKDIWDATLNPSMQASYYDNQDMTMDVDVIGQVEPLMVELLLHGYILPKPMGVRMNINVIDIISEDTSWAQCVTCLNDARQGCPMDYQPDRDTNDTGRAGAIMEAGSGYALARIPIGDSQPERIPVKNGAVGLSNSARIALTVI